MHPLSDTLSQSFQNKKSFINILKNKIMSEIESKVKAIIVDKLGVDEAEVKPEYAPHRLPLLL